MYFPALDEFKEKAKQHRLVPVYREIIVDLDTPISLYQKVCSGENYTYLLESVEGGERLARFSFIGLNPFLIFEAKEKEIKITQKGKETIYQGNPFEHLQKVIKEYEGVVAPELSRFFGGGVGYFSYDAVRYLEELPEKNQDDLDVPDFFFVFAETILVYDHIQHSVKIVVNCLIDEQSPEISYAGAIKKIEETLSKIRGNQAYPSSGATKAMGQMTSNFTRSQFESSVKKIKEYIRAGDVFQVGLSQRFEIEIGVEPLEIYRSLRVVNPSPYMYYLNYGKLQVIGTSPELLLRVEEKTAVTRPIAGTRPRGKTPQEDLLLGQDLLADEKERAEHVMLVDLHRNDLGRVCSYGTVEVDEFMIIEKYSHVMHLVSNVKGQLDSQYSALEAFQASFPAGTVTGAPKIRAMEIIEELEPNRRGIYAGAVGYCSLNGNLDTCITIRTIVVKGNKAYIQAGAGIVADSNPALEYEETLNKARALIKAINLAHGGEGNDQKAFG